MQRHQKLMCVIQSVMELQIFSDFKDLLHLLYHSEHQRFLMSRNKLCIVHFDISQCISAKKAIITLCGVV